MPEEIAKRLRENPDPLKPTIVYGTCLCSDIENYTTLSELLDPKLLTDLTNEYYAVIGEPIDTHQGIRLDIVGDGMTCVWPAPQADPVVRLHACLAALEVQKAIEVFNQRHNEYVLTTRIGLHAGPMAMGNMGGSGHYIYGIAGDVPNTASRIEGLNKKLGTRLLAEHAVVNGLDELLLRPMGRFQLSGKTIITTVFEIVNRRIDATPTELDLCERFSEALALYEAKQSDEAIKSVCCLARRLPQRWSLPILSGTLPVPSTLWSDFNQS